MKTKNQKMQELSIQPGYWSTRAVVQLRYMEELLKSNLIENGEAVTYAVDRLYEIYCGEGSLCKSAVLAWEAECLEGARNVAKSLRVDCIGHAHIDMNWQWGYDETVMVTLDTFRTMLQLMREYPEMVYLQSQASVYRIVEQYAPQMLDEIKQAIKAGQWEVVATTWVEADKNLSSGESMSRHLLYTRQYLKKLLDLEDGDFLLDFEPDTFGHPLQTPTILASGGVKYLYHCRGEKERSLYRWESPSGARITVLREPEWYNAPIEWDSFLYIPQYCSQHGINRMCHVFGVGDHGGGVTRRDLERIRDMTTWPCMPNIGFGKLKNFFEYIEQLDLPVVFGERNFVFDGCYTTQTRIKKENRLAEEGLYHAEALNAFSALQGCYAYEPKAFREAWQKVLFNQFHDILPGSGVMATREHAMGAYQEAMACVGARSSAALRALASCVNTKAVLPVADPLTDSISEGAGVGCGTDCGRFTTSSGVTGGRERLYQVFNTTQYEWNGLVELTAWDWAFAPERAEVCDDRGQVLPHVLLDEEPLHYWAHRYFRILVACNVPAFGYRTLCIRENDIAPPVPVKADPRLDAPVDNVILENNCIRVELDKSTLRIRSLRDKKTGEELLCAGKTGGLDYVVEDDSSGMTAWRIGRYMSQKNAVSNIHLTGVLEHPLRSSISFCGQIEHSQVNVDMWLDKDSRTLHMKVRCKWLEIGRPGMGIPQLAFSLPLKSSCESFTCDTPYSVAERIPHDYDVPALHFACASGVMLTTDCKYGFRCTKDTLSVTLIRSSFDPDDLPEVSNHDFTIGVCVPENNAKATLLRESASFAYSPLVVATMPHEGVLPPSGTMMGIEGNVQISAVKLAEDGSENMIVRMVSMADDDQLVALTLPGRPNQAWTVDVHEKRIEALAVTVEGNVEVHIRPHEVISVCVNFQKPQ